MKTDIGYKQLIVWQKAIRMVVSVYKLCEKLPDTERYGISSQMKRCSVSIPSNIAEGSRRKTRKDFGHFLTIAYGSGAELETQIEILKNLPFGQKLDYSEVDNLLSEVMKMLNKLITATDYRLQPTN